MAWLPPKTNWQPAESVTHEDINRIEGNIAELRNAEAILLRDVANNFAAGNVEEAILELFNSVVQKKGLIAGAITDMGVPATNEDTYAALANKIRSITTLGPETADATAVAGDILSGKTAYAKGSKLVGSMPNHGNQSVTPKATAQNLPAGYYSGVTVDKVSSAGDPNLRAANILKGKSIFGVAGNAWRVSVGVASVTDSIVSVRGLTFTPLFVFIVRSNYSITFYDNGFLGTPQFSKLPFVTGWHGSKQDDGCWDCTYGPWQDSKVFYGGFDLYRYDYNEKTPYYVAIG